MINTLADIFMLAPQSLLKLKKFEGSQHNYECEVLEINQITYTCKSIDGSNNSNFEVEVHSTRPVRIILIGHMLEVQ